MATLPGSLLDRSTVAPPGGAATGSVTVNGDDWPNWRVKFDGRLIGPAFSTVTVTVADGPPGVAALAVIVVEPGPAPVTGTLAVVAPAAIVAVEGIVTICSGAALKLTIKPPAGAGDERVSVRFCVAGPVTVTFCGEKVSVAATWTAWTAGPYPGAEALMLADPKLTPVTCGCVTGVVAPPAIDTVAGDTVRIAGSLLASVTVTPPAGAGDGSVTGNAADCPGATVTFEGRMMASPD
jgi:hypothetical protein